MGEILGVAGVAFGLGFLLIFLAALSEKRRRPPVAASRRTLTYAQFERACCALAERHKLEIDQVHRSGANQIDLVARNPAPVTGGLYLLHGLLTGPDEVVTTPQILELSNQVVQERASKGIFITTGRFPEEIPTLGELAPMEFVDGKRLAELVDYRVILS